MDNEPTQIIRLIAEALRDAPKSSRPWDQRVLLGVWGNKYLPLCKHFMPTYSVTNITFSTTYARSFFRNPYVSFNIIVWTVLLWPIGSRFIRRAHALDRSVILWTVNDDALMRWSIGQGVDGVITDDPKRFGHVAEEWTAGHRNTDLSWGHVRFSLWVNIMAAIFSLLIMSWTISDRLRGKPSIAKRKQLSAADSVGPTRMT